MGNDVPKNKKLMAYLLGKGFLVSIVGDLLFVRDVVNNVGQLVDPSNPLFYPDGLPAQPMD
jgi:hypothetical protein